MPIIIVTNIPQGEMKMSKKVNPYEKKNKKKLRITRKQWTTLLSLLGVAAILVGIVVISNSCKPP